MTRAIGLLLALLVSFAPSAHARLGGKIESVETDRKLLHGQTRVQKHEAYSVHEITAKKGQVREFVRPDGTVFAVSWRGPVAPDLSELLGEYFKDYEDARQQPSGPLKRGPRVVRSQRVIVEQSGHMRDLRGKAYAPDLVPDNVIIGEVQ